MAVSERLWREMERIDGSIEGLREMLYRAEDDLRAAGVRPGLLRSLGVRVLKADLRRRILDLEQRRRMVHNCLVETRKYEGWIGASTRGRAGEGVR